MDTAAAAATAFPQQQAQDPATAASATTTMATSGSTRSAPSGSIGPFIAVISVIAVLTFISCAIGRAYSRRVDPTIAPLDSIERRSFFRWLKEKTSEVVLHGEGARFGTGLKRVMSFWRRGGKPGGGLPQP
ncbi:hypothetical protein SAY87_006511 [Trapa incisa]|uniref:Transmembrane protein n=2 Tax=Trapa TaxID=22665 RepID=A0AAN7QPP2_TRANT|nr:hypothetical protein SAY87_006511 [Trapa incisa]KAK4774304.1 hypothetical protein SAY86_009239 [Trapa natans]